MSQVFDANVDDLDGVELDIAATSIQPSCNKEITSSKTSVSNDCFHVLHSYIEFNYSPSPLLLTAASKYDDETDESVVADTVSSHTGDVINSESFLDEGSAGDRGTICDRAEE